MYNFSLFQKRWISEAMVFLNYNVLYQVYHKEGGDDFVKILATIEDWQLTPLSKLSQTLKKEGSLTQPEFENLVTIIESDPKKLKEFLNQ
jgi:hypothetical protein